MPSANERRTEIMKILCRRRYETIDNLATELGVSTRTIRRDLELLSISEPIYTQAGRYGGGVYVQKGYSMYRMYMTDSEVALLQKILILATDQDICVLSKDEFLILKSLISQYTKPIIKKGEKNNEK